MGRRVRETDWSQTPLGDYQTWPQSLRSSLSLVLNAKGIAALYWGPDQWLLYNDAYGAALGDRHPRAFGLPMPQVLTDIAPVLGPQVAQVLATGEGFAIENLSMVMRRHGRDEETVWTYGFSPVQGETGEFAGVLLIATEMTQQVLAEQRSRASEARQRYRVELGDALRLLGDPGQIQAEACRLLCDNLGASRVHYAEMEDDGEHAVVPHDHAATVPNRAGRYRLADFATLIRACRSGQTYVVANIALDDETAASEKAVLAALPVAAIIVVPLVKDSVLEAILAVQSATPRVWSPEEIEKTEETAERTWAAIERSRADARLRALNDTLQQRIDSALREQATIEEALRQAQKMEAVGQLTGGLAHDFNNLLAGISGSLELMQSRLQQGRLQDVERYVVVAQGAARRAASLTHRLLAFSRRQTLDPRPTDVNRLAQGMQDLIQRTVGPAIPIEVVGASGAWPVRVDASQLENALLNLCLNARDAMPDGGHITIETANKWIDASAARTHNMPEGQYLSVAVTDTGTGMSPEIIERVFEPFFTTKPIGEGTGLGLSMIYGFAQQSGGQVRIYSEVGQGTTICIYLPRHYGEATDEAGVTGPAALHRSEQGKTVLVVDDEPTIRMLLTEILEEMGYTALEAEDSATGLKILQSAARIDLLVTDVGLPGGMNGRQMADAGRVTRPNLKVLFITGYAENAILSNGHLAPGMEVLTKPFLIDTMAERIRLMIEAKF